MQEARERPRDIVQRIFVQHINVRAAEFHFREADKMQHLPQALLVEPDLMRDIHVTTTKADDEIVHVVGLYEARHLHPSAKSGSA